MRDLAVLAVILVVAAAFRLNGLDWDAGTHQHPDERFLTDVASRVALPASWSDYFNTPRSSLNPYARGFDRYAYGQLPLTVTRAAAERVGMTGFENVYLVGRALSALASLGTIVFAWLLARRVLGRRSAHLAALLLAVTVLDIQLAHFMAVDTFVACFAAASLYFGQRAWEKETLADAALAGVMLGLATASKVSALTLLPVLFVALIWPSSGRPSRGRLVDGMTAFGVALICAFLAFRVAEPYAFLGPAVWNFRLNPQWILDKAYWAEVSSGSVDVPYMIQWVGTPAYSFVLQAIVQWGMGPAAGLAALAGLALAAWRILAGRTRDRALLLLVVWSLVNLAYFGGQFAKFLRYLAPIYFALAILAAYALVEGVDWALRRTRVTAVGRGRRGAAGWAFLRALAFAAPVGVVGASAVWALAFSHVYEVPHSRIEASRWIYENVPVGKTLAVEHWDDRLPMPLPGLDPGRYAYQELALYDAESPAKREKLIATLDRSDYVILASRRLADSIPRLPERYPLATTYYSSLFSGQLGFQRVARIQVAPALGPLAIDDGRAQEDFTVYDHPTVEVWAKTADYSSAAVRGLLGSVAVDRAVQVRPTEGGRGGLLLSPEERQLVQSGGTWSSLFDPSSFANQVAPLAWLLVWELMALAAFPLLWGTLRFLPDRGFGASKMLGLVVVGYLVWLGASLKIVPFGRWSIVGAWVLVACLSAAAVWRQRQDFVAWLRVERRLLLALEATFLAGFALFLFIRAANPDLWHPSFGGEKPMNFAYLNAVLRSDFFPPYDPWFAGGIINYYYVGLVLVAVPIKLTGILPEIGFNLAEPSLFGAVAVGAFSFAFGLAVPRVGRLRRGFGYVAGIAGAVLVGLLGNLDAGLQVLEQLWRLGAVVAPQSGGIARLAAGFIALWQGPRFPPLDFWRSTRLIGPEDPGPITEFPYFTFLYGDLHAHQIALPITLAILLVALNLLRSARADARRVPWGSLVWGALLLGVLRATNTWDVPTYLAVVLVALALGWLPALRQGHGFAIRALVVSAAVVVVGSQLAILPFLQRYQLFYTGVEPIRVKTALAQYLTIHGLFVFLSGSLLALYAAQAWRRVAAVRRPAAGDEPPPYKLETGAAGEEPLSYGRTRPFAGAPHADASVRERGSAYYGLVAPVSPGWLRMLGSGPGFLLVLGALLGAGLVALDRPTAGAILGAASWAGAACVGFWRRGARSFHAALVATGLLVTLVPEFVALQGDIGRMNTVFKLYFQAWVLLGTAAAVSLAWLVARASREPLARPARWPWLAVAALLAAAGLCYPLFASEAKIGLRFAPLPLTLDGMAYMDDAQYRDRERDLNLPGDARAIRWLRATVQGTPTVLEGRAPIYRWGSRVSVYTGLPTVLGWDWHEQQQRAAYVASIQERASDVQRAFDSPNPAEALAVLRKYDVRLVYVGGLERAYYSGAGLAKLATMPELRLAYDTDGVRIYEVWT